MEWPHSIGMLSGAFFFFFGFYMNSTVLVSWLYNIFKFDSGFEATSVLLNYDTIHVYTNYSNMFPISSHYHYRLDLLLQQSLDGLFSIDTLPVPPVMTFSAVRIFRWLSLCRIFLTFIYVVVKPGFEEERWRVQFLLNVSGRRRGGAGSTEMNASVRLRWSSTCSRAFAFQFILPCFTFPALMVNVL